MRNRPISDQLLSRVRYDEDARVRLVWVKPRWKKWIGKETGALIREQDGFSHLAHRIVWALHFGDPGDHQIDHIDRNHNNNRIENLRLATPRQNQHNRTNFSGKSQFKGVGLHANGRWRARVDGEVVGYFATEIEAALAYNEAALVKHGSFATLNIL